jgi:hypothetical protein
MSTRRTCGPRNKDVHHPGFGCAHTETLLAHLCLRRQPTSQLIPQDRTAVADDDNRVRVGERGARQRLIGWLRG